MNRIDRLFALLTMLQSRRFTPVDSIAGKFRISVRTVYRDIKALGEAGVPVGFEPDKGYFIMQGYFLAPVSFTMDEANALLLMETLASAFTDKSIHSNYTNALNKVKAVLRSSQKEKLEILNNNTRLQVPARFTQDYEYLSQVQNAIATKVIVELQYKNNKEETSKRQVEPIGLIFYAFSWHLVAWCHLRNDYRDFKISRIAHLQLTGKPFKKQDHIAVNEYMKQLPVNY